MSGHHKGAQRSLHSHRAPRQACKSWLSILPLLHMHMRGTQSIPNKREPPLFFLSDVPAVIKRECVTHLHGQW